VENLSALDPTAVHRPVRIAEIHERLVPYRTHRSILGFDSNEDYEMTLLRLFAGERGFAQVFPVEAATALAKEAASVNPNTGLFRKFPEATVVLSVDSLEEGEKLEEEVPLPDPESEPEPDETEPEPESEEQEQLPFTLEEEAKPGAQPRGILSSAPCPYCGAGLPVGRTVLFCPHCGQNIGVVHCPTCDSELDVGWTFCIACGQKVSGIG
jgi:hypothetical protein